MAITFKRLYPYLVALLAVAAAALIRLQVLGPELDGRAPFSAFSFAVLLAAWVGGFGPGCFATGLSAITGWYLFIVPKMSPLSPWFLGIFLLLALLISVVCEALHRARDRADRARHVVEDGQRQLVTSSERLRAILKAIPHLVWTADESGKITYLHPRWQEVIGEPMEDLEKGLTSLAPAEQASSVSEGLQAAATTTTPFVRELRLKTKNGDPRWYLVHIEPSRDGEGRIDGWFGTATDMDEAHRNIEAAKSSEERFRHLADSAPILIWISDAANSRTWVNRPWLDFTGRTLSEEMGEGWIKSLHDEDVARVVETFRAHSNTRQPFEIDYRIRRRDGLYRWVIDRGIPLFSTEGEFLGFMGGSIDIHERKEAEENSGALLKIEQDARIEAERTALLKDEFLATVSHEMRTPLTAMLGWVQLLRNGSLPSDTVPQALETIERNARAQAKLIDDLLDMSRILSGRLRLDVQSVNILDAVEAAVAAAEPAAAAKKINLICRLDPLTGSVSGDPTRLQQVIWNLLSNAIKFTPAAGTITINLERVNSHLEIEVTDTGEGIDPEFLPHVFDRFRQQDASTVRKHQGLGLGLSIVKQLVEMHGGSVRAKSPGLGLGATFVVALPIVQSTNEPPSRRGALEDERPRLEDVVPTLLGTKVLVVDDDADARELLRSILAQNGASVRVAESAQDAIRQLDERLPNVLVSDIGMPGEDGYDLIRQVRRRDTEHGGQIPALALTAFARSDDRRRAINAGFHMHLAKPVEPAELVTVIASLARR